MSKYTDLIKKAKEGNLNTRSTLVSPKHLEWLLPYVKNLGKGKMVELGVARGGCLALCGKINPQLIIIGCDSWEGMPNITKEDDENKCKQWVGSKWGTKEDVYKTFKKFNAPTDNLILLKGWFEDTLPKNIDIFNDLDILRIDSDFYNSVKYCLDMLYDKVKVGGVIIFDDWHFNNKGVKKAFQDFLNNRNINIKDIEIKVHEKGRGPSYFFKPN